MLSIKKKNKNNTTSTNTNNSNMDTNEQSNINLDIGIKPLEGKVEEINKPSSQLWKRILLFGGILLVLIIVLAIFTNNTKDITPEMENKPANIVEEKPTENTEEPSNLVVEETPTPEDVETPDIEAPDEETPTDGDAPKTGITKDNKKEKIFLIKGYVLYENGIVNIMTVYPEKWFVVEKTQEGLQVLQDATKGKKFSAKTTKLPSFVPVVEFFASADPTSRINVKLVPRGKHNEELKIVPVVNTTNTKKIIKEETKTFGPHTAKMVKYTQVELGEKYITVEATVNVGVNDIIFILKEKYDENGMSEIPVIEQMIRDLRIN